VRILIVDTETTGVDPKTDSVVEVAAMLFDTKHASAIESFACLIRHDGNEAERFNGIPAALLMEQGLESWDVWRRFCRLFADAECVLAHQAEFDRGFVAKSIAEEMTDCSLPALPYDNWDPNKPWVCSMSDLQWPGARESRSLTSLALSLGLGVSHAHRAMSDVDTLARCLTRANEVMRFEWLRTKTEPLPEHGDFLEPMIRRGMRPKTLFYSLAPFEQKHIVKAHGFSWDEAKHGKNWFRHMPAEDAAALPFRVRAVTP
jgi:DNA polymerase-3 subunit epsilon